MRKHLLEFFFPHHGSIGENLAWRNRPPSAINQPPSFKVGEANSVSIEHSESTPIGRTWGQAREGHAF